MERTTPHTAVRSGGQAQTQTRTGQLPEENVGNGLHAAGLGDDAGSDTKSAGCLRTPEGDASGDAELPELKDTVQADLQQTRGGK